MRATGGFRIESCGCSSREFVDRDGETKWQPENVCREHALADTRRPARTVGMTATDFASLIDRLGAASLEAKGLLSDLHAAVKDARHCLRETQAERERVESMVRRAVEDEIHEEAQKAFDDLIPECKSALDRAVEHVLKEFGKIERAIFTGSATRQVKGTHGDLRDLAALYRDGLS
jgi:hypothetical protein